MFLESSISISNLPKSLKNLPSTVLTNRLPVLTNCFQVLANSYRYWRKRIQNILINYSHCRHSEKSFTGFGETVYMYWWNQNQENEFAFSQYRYMMPQHVFNGSVTSLWPGLPSASKSVGQLFDQEVGRSAKISYKGSYTSMVLSGHLFPIEFRPPNQLGGLPGNASNV